MAKSKISAANHAKKRKIKSATPTTAPSSSAFSSSIVEKLSLLRSFVGSSEDGNSLFNERDLSTCLRQAGYNVELAAERLMTGQFQPTAKRAKSDPSSSMSTQPLSAAKPPKLTSSIPSTSMRTSTPRSTARSSQHHTNNHENRHHTHPIPVTPKTPSPTHHVSSSQSERNKIERTPTSVHSKREHHHLNPKDPGWLLCHRWISDGICLQRNGSLSYLEDLQVEHSTATSSTTASNSKQKSGSKKVHTTSTTSKNASKPSTATVRFRGSRMQGQFPKHLRQLLAPLLEADLVHIKAQALMEERFLPMGAHIAFAVWVYLKDPLRFFGLFDGEDQQDHLSSSRLFFQQKRSSQTHYSASSSRSWISQAAFGLLQWAQHGEPYEFATSPPSPSERIRASPSSSRMASDNEEDLHDTSDLLVAEDEVKIDALVGADTAEAVVEDEIPDWAQGVLAMSSSSRDTGEEGKDTSHPHHPYQDMPELEAHEDFRVRLRPYQRQALWWMTQREEQPNDEWAEKSSREQLELLQELVESTSSSSSKTTMTTPSTLPKQVSKEMPIHCDCGPVYVHTKTVEAPSVWNPEGTNPELRHPLWERRFLTRAASNCGNSSSSDGEALSFYVQPIFESAMASPPPPPQPCRGGILADSMGLGKTVMLLALIQSSSSAMREQGNNYGSDEKNSFQKAKTTLIVSPLSLLAQWEEELESKSTLSYRVYYGDHRKHGLNDFSSVDVVLTTYGSLQGEWLAHAKNEQNKGFSTKTRGSLLGQTWKRVILDEAHCIKNTGTVASRACCLLRAERRWCVSGTIIQNSLDDVYGLLKFLKHEPWCKQSFWKTAITTSSAGSTTDNKVAPAALALDRVRRLLAPIMLRRTKDSLDKNGKPILTLPPVETKIIAVDFSPAERQFYDALHRKSLSLFEGFIEAGTASKSWLAIFSLLHRLRQTCDHVALTIKSHMDQDAWDSKISQVKRGNGGISRESVQTPTGGDCDGKNSKDLINQEFLEDLMTKFRSMHNSACKRSIQRSGETENSKDEVDQNGPSAPYADRVAKLLNQAVQSKTSILKEECAICLDPLSVHDSVITPCFHIFCKDCLIEVLRQNGSTTDSKYLNNSTEDSSTVLQVPNGQCPVCTEEIDSSKILRLSESGGHVTTSYLLNSIKSPEAVAIKGEDGAARQALEIAVQGSRSSKLEAIQKELDQIWEEDPCSKVLIFSQFLGFLDLLEESFKSNNTPFARLDGKLSLKERMAVLREFGSGRNNTSTGSSSVENREETGSVLLISMKAGGVGLNLVAARTVFITDPWWNAAVEDQCVDRIHRIGQTADKVRVRKFYVRNSVEERIIELQKRKKNVANEVLCDKGETFPEATTTGSDSRPTMEDFKILFERD